MNSDIVFSKSVIDSYNMYSEQINKFLYKFIKCSFAREEVIQDVFLTICEKKLTLEPGSSKTRNFILTIAKNKALDFIRKDKINFLKTIDIPIDEVYVDKSFYENLDDNYIEGEIIFTLRDTINSFPIDENEIYKEMMYYDSSISQINRYTGKKRYTIEKIKKKVDRKIKENLSKYYK